MQKITYTKESLNQNSESLSFRLAGMKLCQLSGCWLFLSRAPKAEVLELRLFGVVCVLRLNCNSAVPLQSWELCSMESCGTELCMFNPGASVQQPLPSSSLQWRQQLLGLDVSHWGEQWQQEEQRAKGGWGSAHTFCMKRSIGREKNCRAIQSTHSAWAMGEGLHDLKSYRPTSLSDLSWATSGYGSCRTCAFCSAVDFPECPHQKGLKWDAWLCVLQCWSGTNRNLHSPGSALTAHPWPRVCGCLGPGVWHAVLQNVHGADGGEISSLQCCWCICDDCPIYFTPLPSVLVLFPPNNKVALSSYN